MEEYKEYKEYKDYIFVSNPCTGSTAIKKYICFKKTYDHMRPNEIKEPENSSFLILFRNPVDRFKTAFYHHMTLDNHNNYYKTIDSEKSTLRYYFVSINDFIDSIVNVDHKYYNYTKKFIDVYAHFWPQVDFIGPNYTVIEYSKFFKEHNIPKVNKTPYHRKEQITPESILKLKKIYSEDFQKFLDLDKTSSIVHH